MCKQLVVNVHPDDSKTAAIPSMASGSHTVHFVTPKADDSAVLVAHIPAQLPGHEIAVQTNPEVASICNLDGALLTIRIPRLSAGRIILRILRQHEELWSGLVWIVWSDVTCDAKHVDFEITRKPYSTSGTWTTIRVQPNLLFFFAVAPPQLVADDPLLDIPNLRGKNTLNPPTDVPNQRHWLSGRPLILGADCKWDVSRRVRAKLLNPNLVPPAAFPPLTTDVLKGSAISRQDFGSIPFDRRCWQRRLKCPSVCEEGDPRE